MGIADKFRNKAGEAVDKMGGAEQADEHISTAADKANSATGGRYEQHVDKAEEGAKSSVDKLSRDDQPSRDEER